MAVRPVEIVAGGPERDVSDAAFLIDRHFIPVVNTARSFPRVRGPRLVSELARVRNGVKHPRQFSGAYVVGVNIGRRRVVRSTAGGQRLDEQVFKNAPGIAGLQRADFADIAVEAVA